MSSFKSYPLSNNNRISIIVLFALLCAFFSHFTHADVSEQAYEQHKCQFCQQSVDAPPPSVTLKESVSTFFIVIADKAHHIDQKTTVVIPQLRAPPISI